jgi:hypothetical protein
MGVGSQCHTLAALSQEKRPGSHFTGGLVGPTASLDGGEESCPHQCSIPRKTSMYKGVLIKN